MMEVKGKNVREKRRNAEKKKEKSRFAARCRRSKESEFFSSLAQVIPVQSNNVTHLDKASIMRLVIAHLRLRNIFSKTSKSDFLRPNAYDCHFLKAIGGIIVIISTEGDIIYISPNVSFFLGMSEVDLMGQNIYDICHPCDHKEMKDVLSGKVDEEGRVSMFLRMKCTLTPKGRNLHIKSASYKVLHLIGSMLKSESSESEKSLQHFAAIGSPIPHPVNIETPLGSFTFLSKHSLDMKYTYADERMKNFLGYTPESLIGKSLYEFHHVLDNKHLQKAFKSLFAKGQSETEQYRFLAKGGGYVWVYTQATIIYCDKRNKPESVVCVNYVISEKFNASEIYSSNQLEVHKDSEKTEEVEKGPVICTSKVFVKITPPSHPSLVSHGPLPVTSKVFTTRTAEMNKGFITFDSGCAIMKDDPEDLTHLAPTAGDTCISLDTSPYNCIVDDLSMPMTESYTSPLINSEKDTTLYVRCIDDTSSCSLSPVLSKSPGASSLPSLCGSQDESTFEEATIKSYVPYDFLEIGLDDMNSKAPYIPMSEEDLTEYMEYDLLLPFANPPTSISCASPPMQETNIDGSLSKLLIKDNNAATLSFQDQGGGPHSEFMKNKTVMETTSDIDRRKRSNYSVDLLSVKKRKHHESSNNVENSSNNSVLMNLLVAGQDLNAGYICINTRKKSQLKSSPINST